MKRILFYYPSNKRSVQIETTLIELQKLGHQITLLTTCPEGALHQNLKEFNIPSYTHPSRFTFSPLYYLQQILYLVQFCKKHQIDLVFSNLQHANFIAVFAQFLMKAKVIAFRHHFKFSKGNFGIPLEVNKTEALFDKVINRLAKTIIVPSKGVFDGIKTYEKIKLDKLSIIPYLYDFSKYGSPNLEQVETLKKKYKAQLNIIMVARLIPFKRHMLMLPTYKKLINEGFDIQVTILDEGPCKEEIEAYINKHQLNTRIHLIGFTTHFLEYMKAADLLIHPSLTEASNNVTKEIGLMKKVVAVCEGVGDFDDYLVDGENGFLMQKEQPEKDAEKIIRALYQNPEQLIPMGEALHRTILARFGNNAPVLEQYKALIDE